MSQEIFVVIDEELCFALIAYTTKKSAQAYVDLHDNKDLYIQRVKLHEGVE